MIADERVVLKVVAGSHAYGLNVEGSDHDFKSVYVPALDDYLSLNVNKTKVGVFCDGDNQVVDSTIYNINKFFSLLIKSNPTVLEIVFSDSSEWIVFENGLKELIMSHRDLFFDDVPFVNAMNGTTISYYKKFKRSVTHLTDGGYNPDYKSLMHALRLARMCNEFLKKREFIVKRTHDKDYLLSVRYAKVDPNIVTREIESLMDENDSCVKTNRDPKVTQKLKEVSHSYVRNFIKDRV